MMILKYLPWSDKVEGHLSRIQGDDCLSWYRCEVAGQRARVIGVTNQGDELVIVACGGRSPDNDVMDKMLPLLERVAATQWGFISVRFHTIREGLGAKAVRHGYNLVEWVYRKDVTHHVKKIAV